MALTKKQQLFITEYLIDLNGSAAMRRAGYTSKNPDVDASKLLVNPSIRQAIDSKLQQRALDNGVTADMVLKDLIDLKDKCLGRKPVKTYFVNKDGESVEDERTVFDPSGAKASLELLGKHLKLFTDKVETENTNLNYDMSNLTDAELEAEIERLKSDK